jgi:hypothetical protein
VNLRPLIGLLVGATLVAGSACGGAEPAPAAVPTPVAATTEPDRVGSIGDAVEVAAGAPGGAGAAACASTEQTLTAAVELFLALEGSTPADQRALVEAGFVREASPWFEITADGAVVPDSAGPCA